MMDEIAKYNQERWKALVAADAVYTRAATDLNPVSARELLDPDGRLGDLFGKDVLCLAGGGGQQSAAYALLGANVTVFDLSEDQLQKDAEIAAHYGFDIKILQGDMRDMSALTESAFDIVDHAYSLGFVPEVGIVFQNVARVLRLGGIYYFNCANPFFLGTTERDWNGEGYSVKQMYIDGTEITYEDQAWVYDRTKRDIEIRGAREFRHTLSSIVESLVKNGFLIEHVSDSAGVHPDPNAEPGTWDHFVSVAPPWLSFWTRLDPEKALHQ